jgi:endonuclease III
MGQRGGAAEKELVRRLLAQKTYPELLGLDVSAPADWFPWFVASSLFAKPISAAAARTTALLLFKERVLSPAAIKRVGWEGLVAILDLGGYVRYDFSTATKLLTLAAALPRDRLRRVVSGAASAKDVEAELTKIQGVGPKTVAIFLRELRGLGGPPVPVSEEARSAAKRLQLKLRALDVAGRDLSRLESVLVRTWVEHCKRGRWQSCPAGAMCGCAALAHRSEVR